MTVSINHYKTMKPGFNLLRRWPPRLSAGHGIAKTTLLRTSRCKLVVERKKGKPARYVLTEIDNAGTATETAFATWEASIASFVHRHLARRKEGPSHEL